MDMSDARGRASRRTQHPRRGACSTYGPKPDLWGVQSGANSFYVAAHMAPTGPSPTRKGARR